MDIKQQVLQWKQQQSERDLYCVIGDPIKQSKSPLMLNKAFSVMQLDAKYGSFQVASEQLEQFMDAFRACSLAGMNVTIPHKQHVMEFLDEIDADAKALGAVNTVVNRNGRLIGYNTDGIGYVRSLKEEAAATIAGKVIVVLGAGGASRGIIYTLLREQPASLIVVNRTLEKAEEIVASLQSHVGTVQLQAASNEQLAEVCGGADIVINTTSVGMYPHADESPVDCTLLKQASIASDLIYNPLKTAFLHGAEGQGCTSHGGLGMFVYQGAYAFEYWTGLQAPTTEMRSIVLQALES